MVDEYECLVVNHQFEVVFRRQMDDTRIWREGVTAGKYRRRMSSLEPVRPWKREPLCSQYERSKL